GHGPEPRGRKKGDQVMGRVLETDRDRVARLDAERAQVGAAAAYTTIELAVAQLAATIHHGDCVGLGSVSRDDLSEVHGPAAGLSSIGDPADGRSSSRRPFTHLKTSGACVVKIS